MSVSSLTRGVAADLAARRFPFPVIFGPERMTRAAPTDTCIVIERDRDGGDGFDSVMGVQVNRGTNTPAGRRQATRFMGVQAMIWAKSNLTGADEGDHEDLCDQLVDALYSAVDTWQQANVRVMNFKPTGRYLKAHEIAELVAETWPGVVYLMRWRLPHGVYSTDFKGLALPDGTVSGITGEVRVRRNASDPPEIVEIP